MKTTSLLLSEEEQNRFMHLWWKFQNSARTFARSGYLLNISKLVDDEEITCYALHTVGSTLRTWRFNICWNEKRLVLYSNDQNMSVDERTPTEILIEAKLLEII